MLLRVRKLLFVVLMLVAVAGANASPTATTDNAFVPTVQAASDTPAVIAHTKEVVGPIDAELANLGAEFLQPPASSAVLGNAQGNHVKPLPAVPAAIFMVLFGFLCVSLVRDRKLWLAALAGLLWAGQIGIQALPQLALRLSRRNHSQQQFSAELTYPYYLENSNRLRSDIEGTQYISLLHYLAGIPNASLVHNPWFSTLDSRFSRVSSIQHRASSINTFPSAIISERYSLNPLLACLASKAEQFICFSPAFIFDIIPRGPPKLT